MSSYNKTEDQFFDTPHDVALVSDLSSNGSEDCSSSELENTLLGYELWTKKPESVNERRDRFLKLMTLSSHCHRTDAEEEKDSCHEETERDVNRLRDNEEAELASLDSESEPHFFSSRSLKSVWAYDATDTLEDGADVENLTWKIKNLESRTELEMDKLSKDGDFTIFREVGLDKMTSLDNFQKKVSPSALVKYLLQKDTNELDVVVSKKKVKSNWLQRFSAITQIADKTKGFLDEINAKSLRGGVRVHAYKKHSKELSSLYTGQEFTAHEGSILAMKFSHDGRYLASAGVDGVVRVWNVLEDDIGNKLMSQDFDPSCLYFSMDHSSKLTLLNVGNEKTNMKKSSDLACVILPPKVFRLLEKPLQEFHGHNGEVLALSWSKNGHLLSSSVDKTARLWKIGHDHCLGTYPHNNYVTCVDFNPGDDNHFITGSIDGKIRIWETQGGRVVDWTDIGEIVTAVCYRPDGKGGIVGSMDGDCWFFYVEDNCLQLGAQICLKGKKKFTGKKIIGFQYCPNDSSKVMVTSADSQVRIFCGTNIVCKFKGNRSSGSQVPALFTSDAEHIISSTEDSNIRIWNYTSHNQKSSQSKTIRSCENFTLPNASIAIPWSGLKNKIGSLHESILGNDLLQKLPVSFPDCFTTSLGFFIDAIHKGSATWPEDKLPNPDPVSGKHKSEFKFLKNAWMNTLNSPNLWGLVIVTAGWDGCIRTFLNHGLPIRF